jgi:hypothetical protein
LLHVITTDVQSIRLSNANEVMHLNMVFLSVNDGLNNLMHQMQDWHETMLEHGNICKKRVHEYKKST